MRHDDYVKSFRWAAETSAKWGLIELAKDFGPAPEAGRAIEHLPLVAWLLDGPLSPPIDSATIRRSCGSVASWLFKQLYFVHGVRCLPTVGDVDDGGKLEYSSSYPALRREIQALNRDPGAPYNFHVWLTFPDMHVIDATWFVYKHHDRLPEPWRWSEHVVCSDHPFAAELDIKYVPMLVGADLIERMGIV